MTHFEQFWLRITTRNPGFAQDDSVRVTMSIGQVRKLIKKAHADGFETAMQLSKSLDNLGTQTMEDVIKDAINKTTGNQYVTGSGKSLGGTIEVCIRRFDRDCIVEITKSNLRSEGVNLAILELSPKDLEIASRVFRREDFGIRSYRLGVTRDKMVIDGLLFDKHLKHVRQLC